MSKKLHKDKRNAPSKKRFVVLGAIFVSLWGVKFILSDLPISFCSAGMAGEQGLVKSRGCCT
jgi:hypothetical protein